MPWHDIIIWGQAGLLKLVMDQVLIDEFLEIILLVLVDVEILAVKVKQAVSEFWAGQGAND